MYRNNVPFGTQSVPQSQGGQPVYAPAMQGVQDTYVAQRVKKADYSWAGVPIGVATWLGICKGMDYFNNTLCSKDYAETPFGKIGAWGDKVSNSYFNSSFAKSEAGQGFHGFLRKTRDYINNNIIGKSKVLTAIKTTPTNPEHKMVIAQAKGLLGLHNMEIDTLLPSFIENSEVPEQLERYGLKKDAIDKIKASLKGKKKAEKLALLEAEEFKIFGVNNADALKEAKIKALGFKDAAQYERIAKDFIKYPDEILDALKKAHPDMKITRCQGEGKFGWLNKYFLKRDITFKELANKYLVAGNNTPHATKLGRGMAKGLAWVMEGMTNRFAGGKFMAIMQAMFLTQGVLAALNADGMKEKAKTFIEQNVNMFSYVFAAPLAIMMMHRAGGMKYSGMTPEQVANFRTKLEAFNAKAKAGGFASKSEYKAAKQELTKLLQGDTKNGFFTKMCKQIGKFINIGNEKIHPYIKNGEGTKNFFRKLGYWSKNAAGYPLRFGLAMFALMPFVSTTVTKASNLIFGKPKKSVLDEDGEDEAKAAKAENVNAQLSRLRQDALQRQQAVAQHQQAARANANAPRMDMLQRYKQAQNGQNVVNNTTNVYNNQPAEQPKKQEPVRTYIPSPIGVQTQMPNVDMANDALQRSMQAEAEAMKILGMR